MEERLPVNPLILQPEERVGTYGGTLHVLVSESATRPRRVIGAENLVRWDLHWQRVLPNVAQAVEASPDATTYTFHLRKGMRWSDGAPFGADDILFWHRWVLLDPRLTPRPMSWLTSAGQPVGVEKVDELTVVFRFAEPNAFFLPYMASVLGIGPTRYPHHYLERFHGELGGSPGDGWVARFRELSDPKLNPELPTLDAWVATGSQNPVTVERNPYYWKIDTDYNQLPYIDRMVFETVVTPEACRRHMADGVEHLAFEHDLRGFAVPEDFLSGLRRITLVPSSSSVVVIGLNLTHADPTLRRLFQNKDFRIGLSHAIDRRQIGAEILDGRGQPYQVAPRPESPDFHRRLASQYTEYDPRLAAEHLDRAGCGARDGDGFRLAPDGTPLSIRLPAQGIDTRYLDRIVADWRAVGVRASWEDYSTRVREYSQILFSNSHDTYISSGVGGLHAMLQPVYYVPAHPWGSWYASGWGHWNHDPNDPKAVEPPAEVKHQIELYNRLQRTLDPDEQASLMREILEVAADQFYVIGTVLTPPSAILASPRLHNVPRLMPDSALLYPAPAPSNPAQYFLDRGDAAEASQRGGEDAGT